MTLCVHHELDMLCAQVAPGKVLSSLAASAATTKDKTSACIGKAGKVRWAKQKQGSASAAPLAGKSSGIAAAKNWAQVESMLTPLGRRLLGLDQWP